jgi:hypothetical protein
LVFLSQYLGIGREKYEEYKTQLDFIIKSAEENFE